MNEKKLDQKTMLDMLFEDMETVCVKPGKVVADRSHPVRVCGLKRGV